MKYGEKLQVCWQAFSMENSLLQSYRMLFLALEAALLALGFVLLQMYGGAWLLVPASFGWVVAPIWVIVCEAKGKDVDLWMNRIVNLQSATRPDWFEYLEPGAKFSGGRFARYLFNYVMPLVIVALWVVMVVYSFTHVGGIVK